MLLTPDISRNLECFMTTEINGNYTEKAEILISFFLFVSRNLSALGSAAFVAERRKNLQKRIIHNIMDFILRFLALLKLKLVWLWSSGLTKNFRFFRLCLTLKTIERLSAEPIQGKQGLRDYHSTSVRVKNKVH